MLENPQVAKDLIYNYRGIRIKGTRNEAGWNSVYIAGKIIEKIGPILAIKNEEFYNENVVKKLIKNYPKSLGNLNIKGLALNSKDIRKGFIFFAIRGNEVNGENFINDAVKNGAALIICSKRCKFKSTKKIQIIKTSNVKNYLSEVTSKFYKLKPKNIIAVTGTNGKTSVVDFFYQLLEK